MDKKKILKISGITLASLVAVVMLVGAIACWIIFTPKKVTPIVKDALGNILTCDVQVDTVDLTFFSTFPHFGLHIANLELTNDLDSVLPKQLCKVNDCTLSLDLMSFFRQKQLVVTECRIKDGAVNLWVNGDGVANYNIVNSDTTDTTSSIPFKLLDVEGVELKRIALSYVDVPSKLNARIDNVEELTANLKWQEGDTKANANLDLDASGINFSNGDTTILIANASQLALRAKVAQNGPKYEGKLSADMSQLSVDRGNVNYLRQQPVKLALPFSFDKDNFRIQLEDATATVANKTVSLDGFLASADAGYDIDMTVATPEWDIVETLALVPEAYQSLLKGIDVKGDIQIEKARIAGRYNDSTMPEVTASFRLDDGTLKVDGFPYVLNSVDAAVDATVNLNDSTLSRATIKSLHAETLKSVVDATGEVSDLMGDPLLDLKTNVDVNLPDAKAIVTPKLQMKGRAKGPLAFRFTLNDITKKRWEKMVMDGTLSLSNFDLLYNDTVAAKAQKATMAVKVPSTVSNKKFKEFGRAHITSQSLDASIVDLGKATGKNADINVGLSNPLVDEPLSLTALMKFSALTGDIDSIDLNLASTNAQVTFYPSKAKTHYDVTLLGNTLKANGGPELTANADRISVNGTLLYDESKEDVLKRWNPQFNVAVYKGLARSNKLIMPVEMSQANIVFTPSLLTINNSNIQVGASDFNLHGSITNLQEWLNNEALLKGKINLSSNSTDVYEIMDLVSGFGIDSTAVETGDYEAVDNKEDDPFLVPLGTDLLLVTNIKKAVVGNSDFRNVQGKVRVKDGILVLDEMGMTCDAATMQLTAMYRSERKNHLFVGADFHLLNIDIDKLIDMIPAIDTIVPMLSSFKGRAEFHLAAEGYLKSNYQPKYSTLRGAASIEGQDLVLLDSETFSTIAKYLLFNKKTENKVDSMSLELTLFRNEVELFPFLIQMDKYQAVVQGRYSLTPHYDAHIETLAPVRLALNVVGDEEANFKYRLGKTQYGNMYKPERRNAVQERTLALKKLISDALKETMKDEEYFQDNDK